jgi:ribosome-associated translation inhibitor RaiA
VTKRRKTPRPPLPKKLPKSVKRTAGATSAAETPLNLRTSGLNVDDATRGWVRRRMGRALAKFALHVERATVRFADLNGPRGGVDTGCTIKVVLSGLPSVVGEARASAAREAFDRAASTAERAVRKALERAAELGVRKTPRRRLGRGSAGTSPAATPAEESLGSQIGRRVGRSAAQLARVADRPEKRRRDQPIDTALPGVTASDRKAGYGSTAKRNTLLETRKTTATLEDSEQDRPSRKSSRKSGERAKRDGPQRLRETAETSSPAARARKGKAGRKV